MTADAGPVSTVWLLWAVRSVPPLGPGSLSTMTAVGVMSVLQQSRPEGTSGQRPRACGGGFSERQHGPPGTALPLGRGAQEPVEWVAFDHPPASSIPTGEAPAVRTVATIGWSTAARAWVLPVAQTGRVDGACVVTAASKTKDVHSVQLDHRGAGGFGSGPAPPVAYGGAPRQQVGEGPTSVGRVRPGVGANPELAPLTKLFILFNTVNGGLVVAVCGRSGAWSWGAGGPVAAGAGG